MNAFRLILQLFMSLAMLFAGVSSTQAQSTTPAVPQTNAEIRQWYNDQVAVVPTLDLEWIAQGLSPEQRALKAYEIRHHARLQARAYMQDKVEVADLQARDMAKYGNPDGPTFEYLVQKNKEKGLIGAAVYEDIIGSANRTSAEYNAKFGIQPAVAQ
ncbi:MAG: hypothetical protein RLY71_661 [Pseudomonadota bacterium]